MLKKVKYQGVSLPIPLIEEIKKHISKNPQIHGVPEFVRIAIREKMHKESDPVIIRGKLDEKIHQLEKLTGKKYQIQGSDDGDQFIEILAVSPSGKELIPVIDKKIKTVSPLVDKKLNRRVDNLESKVDEILTILKKKN